MTLPYVFPSWDEQKSQTWATWYVCIQAFILTAAFSAMLINSMFGKKSPFVTTISVAFVISDVAIALGTLLFNKFENYVVTDQWAEA